MAFLPSLGLKTLVMGILNVTPDSFSDGGRYAAAGRALAHAAEMVEEGADMIDVGGESTRPGASEVGVDEEMRRVLPVIERLVAKHTVPISIDTYKAATAVAALEAGARIVNDVWGLQRDPEMARVVAAHGATVVIMHNRHALDPAIDIIEDMRTWFARSIDIAHEAGIADEQIILDPGVGFAKSTQQNIDAIARLPELKALGYPVLVGVSRKSFLARLADRPHLPQERLFGTVAANVTAILRGADIVRVHDVRAHVEAARVVDAIKERIS